MHVVMKYMVWCGIVWHRKDDEYEQRIGKDL